MKFKRIVALIFTIALMGTLFVGCSEKKPSAGEVNSKKEGTETTAEVKESANEKVTINMFMQQAMVDSTFGKAKEDFEKENPNVEIVFNMLPGDSVEAYAKQDLQVLSGDTTDIVFMANSNIQAKYLSANLLLPLNEVAKKAGYDMDTVFGKYLNKAADGTVSMLPYEVSMNMIYYNKKIFDDAGVPYPTGDWTWDEYVEIAKKLTDPTKDIYGSLMQSDWEYYGYIQAMQKKVPAYKEDGSSNLDDPAFAESLKFFKDLSDVYMVQPSLAEFKARKYQFDTFMSGKFGMQMIGSWFMGIAKDYSKYPRDWEIGMCAPPAPEGGKNMLSSGGSLGINKNSPNPDIAFKVLTYFSSNAYKYAGNIPPRADLQKEDIVAVFNTSSEELKGEVTPDDLYNTFYPEYLGLCSEKIVGLASAQINEAYLTEGAKYLYGVQSLEDTMKNLKTMADEFIKQEQEKGK